MLFANRLEVWNPGALPPSWTLEKLRHPHPSVPHNLLLADPLYLTKYIERIGTGTGDMIRPLKAKCVEMTAPDKPKSSQQKYRLTAKGLLLKEDLIRLQQSPLNL